MRLLYAKTSLGKLEAAVRSVTHDGRIHGSFLYHGARTARVTGRGFQPTNMKRAKTPERYFEDLHTDYGIRRRKDPIEDTAKAMRGFIKAPHGQLLAVADFSQIEARILAALAKELELVADFREGRPVYEKFASELFMIPMEQIAKDSDERQCGKMGILSCGYGVGKDTLQEQARVQYGIDKDIDFFDHVIRTYRSRYTRICNREHGFWARLEAAAFATVRGTDTHPFSIWNDYLCLELPSGRLLFYPEPRIIDTRRPWGDVLPSVTYMSQANMTRKWIRLSTYGGKLVENTCQAIGADLIYHAMRKVEEIGFKPIMQLYDEIVSTCLPYASMDKYLAAMCDIPQWAIDLGIPVDAEAFTTERYTK
jgi:DNA polymerase